MSTGKVVQIIGAVAAVRSLGAQAAKVHTPYARKNMDFISLVTWENFETQNPYNAPQRFSDVGNDQHLTSWLHDFW